MVDDNRPRSPSASPTRRSSESGVQVTSPTQQSLANSAISQDQSSRRRSAPMHASQESYGTISRQLTSSLDTMQSPRTPRPRPTPRRATSTHYPHRGQEFSVDDGEDEIDTEVEKPRKPEKHARIASSSVQTQSTLRRRTTNQVPTLAKLPSEDEEGAIETTAILGADMDNGGPSGKPTLVDEPEEVPDEDDGANTEEDDGNVSDAESFTLKDRQEAINVTHPFGIRIWKPALYKKDRSVQKTAEDEIHSIPGLHVNRWLLFFNQLWTLFFGWWLALICLLGAVLCAMFGFMSEDALAYGRVLSGLSGYLLYPFGKFVTLVQDETYAAEDEGEGRSISEYEQWQSGDIEEGRLIFGPLSINRSLIGRRRTSFDSADERDSLLGRQRRGVRGSDIITGPKTRFFGRGKWNFGRVVFFLFFHLIITPFLLGVCALCWFLVFSIPMGKVTWLLWDHLRRHPLALGFRSDGVDIRTSGGPPSSVLLCTYRAVGLKYWKFTIDGTNIFLFNLLGIVAFTIFDFYVLAEILHLNNVLTNQGLMFALALFSIIPLAYFIGQAVASISAQSSMGVGATVNAFFSTVVEVFLYCVALSQGKAQLVEGSVIGSIFAGILFLPGLSMCFGALKRKTQRFNVRSAGVTSTMMLFAMIGAFGPTLFYQIYGSHELQCHECKHPPPDESERDCRRCFFSQVPAVHDRFYNDAVLPYIWFSATALFLGYMIGLLFTLRTHAAIIWSTETDEKKPEPILIQPSSSLHETPEALTRQATSGTILKQDGTSRSAMSPRQGPGTVNANSKASIIKSPLMQPPKIKDSDIPGLNLQSLSDADNLALRRHVAQVAASAVVAAARESTKLVRKTSLVPPGSKAAVPGPKVVQIDTSVHPPGAAAHAAEGHDAPNWSKTKSAVILCTATLAYAIIAEILVSNVDSVLENVTIDEKFLGITLFALVPNTTEFLNAISFAMNGNVSLSMEIGSAYALQVCMLQIPALVFFTAFHGAFVDPANLLNYSFTLIFPQWDMVTVILCIFLLSYMYGEGKSNYFKGSILILTYCVVIVGFWFAGFDTNGAIRGVHPVDTLAVGTLGELKWMVKNGAIRPDREL